MDKNFKNQSQVSKYLTFLGTHISYAKTVFKWMKRASNRLCYCYRYTFCHSIRANTRTLSLIKIKIFTNNKLLNYDTQVQEKIGAVT